MIKWKDLPAVYDRAVLALKEEMFVLDLPNERKLLSSDDDRLVLTTHRVRFQAKSFAFSRVTSIMLGEVSACEIATTSKPWLFMCALLFLLIGFYLAIYRKGILWTICLFVAFFCGLAYLDTRRQVISVRSSGGSINVPTQGMGLEKATDFIDQVELAKHRYFRTTVLKPPREK
jgi:hypothetical protein